MFQRRMFNTDSPKDNPTTQSTMKLVSEESLLKQQEELKKVEEKSTTDVSESNNNLRKYLMIVTLSCIILIFTLYFSVKKFDISSILTYGLYGYIGYLTVDTIRIIFFNNPVSPTN